MKVRKTLTHTLLKGELFSPVKFLASTADLKKMIESLIKRDYLDRDRGQPGMYKYLA
ncbi:unnamed protein product [Sphacelaria rigidula]